MPNDSNIINLNPEDPLASKLRNAVKAACDPSRPVLVAADAQGNIKASPPQEVKLTPFPDGVLFRHSPNKAKPGTCLLHDSAGVVVALVINSEIADILAKGTDLFFRLAMKQIEDAKAAEKVVETLAAPTEVKPE